MKKLQALGRVLSIEEQKSIIGGLALECAGETKGCTKDDDCCTGLVCVGCSEVANCQKPQGECTE